MEIIQAVREQEKLIFDDVSNINNILFIRNVIKKNIDDDTIVLATLHSLRRIFIHLLDTAVYSSCKLNKNTSVFTWLNKQYKLFKNSLYELIFQNRKHIVAPSLRTLIEFVKRDYLVYSSENVFFGYETFSTILQKLLACPNLDIDIVLMMRQEIFHLADCSYYAMRAVYEVLLTQKNALATNSHDVVVLQNALDILRVMNIPLELSQDNMLLPDSIGYGIKQSTICEGDDSDSEGEDLQDEDDNDTKKKASILGTKRKTHVKGKASKKRAVNITEEMLNASNHKKIFGKAWIALLSFPYPSTTHKAILKHLPIHVIPSMSNPLLLADYLTKCYDMGGVLSVLALESLFVLIANHNLDSPKFFESLYRLCNIEVFSAKYRTTFMKLLSKALRSTNIPAYLAAAFIKRLMHLALHAPTPSATFCLLQAFRLLQAHPACLSLVHKSADSTSTTQYNVNEEDNLEQSHALASSLWEAVALQNHYYPEISELAHKFQEVVSSALDIRKCPPFADLDGSVDAAYPTYIETELQLSEKNKAFAFKRPDKLIPVDSVLDKCFSF